MLKNILFPNEDGLYNETTFYKKFLKDLDLCSREVIIESPYITSARMETFSQVFQRLLHKNIRIYIVTRNPTEHETEFYRDQATNEILRLTEMGVQFTLLQGYHHRKLAILDRKILWEGSLNILSQTKSLEFMRRTEEQKGVKATMRFLNYSSIISTF